MSIQRFIFQYILSQITQSVKKEVINSISPKSAADGEEHSEKQSVPQLTCEHAETPQKKEEKAVDAGFVFAMPMEAVGITDFFRSRRIIKAANRKFTAGQWGKFNAVSVISGVGQENAAKAAELLIDAFKPLKIISAGYSGGLSKRLKPLTVCFPEAVISEDSSRIIDLTNAFPQYLPENETAENKLTLLTVNSAVMSPSAKRELYRKTGAELVDMETFAAAAVCLERNVPFLSVRIILDAVDEEFPKDVQRISKAAGIGKVRLAGSLAGAFFKRPALISDLYLLRRKTEAASDKLAKCIMQELTR